MLFSHEKIRVILGQAGLKGNSLATLRIQGCLFSYISIFMSSLVCNSFPNDYYSVSYTPYIGP